jgi:hypothetical protein
MDLKLHRDSCAQSAPMRYDAAAYAELKQRVSSMKQEHTNAQRQFRVAEQVSVPMPTRSTTDQSPVPVPEALTVCEVASGCYVGLHNLA